MPVRLIVIALVLITTLSVGVLTSPSSATGRSFDAERLATHEVEMWRAYYAKERLHLFRVLVVSLREQFGYSWLDAVRAAYHLARAAAWFGDAREGYERVLPDLTAAFALARGRMGARFDPREVARAELAWWVARRTPGENAPAQVGEKIAAQYALFYEVPVARVAQAGRLRAEAAALRDRGGAAADWSTVGTILQRAYRELNQSLQ